MKRTSTILAILAFGLLLVTGSEALAQKTKDVPVTTILEGTGALQDGSVNNYRIQSDMAGPYRNGVDSVVSVMQGFGEWQFGAFDSSLRSVLLDFRDPVPNSKATAPLSIGRTPAKFVTRSYGLYNNAAVAGMKGLNSTLISPLVVTFGLEGNTYVIWMSSVKYPETNFALVTCTRVVEPSKSDTSQCSQWKIEPAVTQPDGQRKNIAKVVRLYTAKGRILEEDHGDFYMSFSISLTGPLEKSAWTHMDSWQSRSYSREGEGSGYEFWRSARTSSNRPSDSSNASNPEGSVAVPSSQPRRIR